MNILIFAAGLGTRLKPLTDTMPKALVPIHGTPLLGILIQKLKNMYVAHSDCSCDTSNLHIVINIHHFADQIIQYVRDNDSFGIDIKFSDERDMLLETGGGLKKAMSLFPDDTPILIHNVDILSNVDLYSFYKQTVALFNSTSTHPQPAASLMVNSRNSSRYLLFDENDHLAGWTNVNTNEVKSPYPQCSPEQCKKYAFSGIHIVNPKVLKPYLDKWQGKFSITDFYIATCDKVSIIANYLSDLNIIDVGKLDTLDTLQSQDIEQYITSHEQGLNRLEYYFPNLTDIQRTQISQLYNLYFDWNQKINVISRKDIENLYEHHVLHSLSIAKVFQFPPNSRIMDLGCGGGFPGIPLAIMFPECQFHLVDSIGKKIKVAQSISESIGLKNVIFSHSRGEDIKGHYNTVVTRAVMPMNDLIKCVGKKTSCIIALKGGELDKELSDVHKPYKIWNISEIFSEEFFQTKKIISVKC